MDTRLIAITVLSLSAIGLNTVQADGSGASEANVQDQKNILGTPPSNAPKSSLSPKAMTPAANPDGANLPGTVKAYSDTQSKTAPAPENAGAINANKLATQQQANKKSSSGAPKSSLSSNADTPAANPNGANLPDTVKSYSGSLNPNK